jgi:hypothetical protein
VAGEHRSVGLNLLLRGISYWQLTSTRPAICRDEGGIGGLIGDGFLQSVLCDRVALDHLEEGIRSWAVLNYNAGVAEAGVVHERSEPGSRSGHRRRQLVRAPRLRRLRAALHSLLQQVSHSAYPSIDRSSLHIITPWLTLSTRC